MKNPITELFTPNHCDKQEQQIADICIKRQEQICRGDCVAYACFLQADKQRILRQLRQPGDCVCLTQLVHIDDEIAEVEQMIRQLQSQDPNKRRQVVQSLKMRAIHAGVEARIQEEKRRGTL